jgi:hypothetical protein
MGALAACTPVGDGTRESCVGPYTGTFEVDVMDIGPVKGRILARFEAPNVQTVEPELELDLTFDNETIMPMGVLADVSEAGEVVRRQGSFDWEGTFNFDDCEASGTFSSDPFYTNGTWRLTTGYSAY